jgi:tRNA (mo5U34)-methyltransferase
VTVTGTPQSSDETQLRQQLMQLHPWRKGPFQIFDVFIDTEWRSDWKWDRLQNSIELRDRDVLDIGCGNGYYGWRMLNAGARRVVGLDPFLLYVMQHEAIRRYAPSDAAHYVLPVGDDCLAFCQNAFDVTFSMGVLYHRSSPVAHLQTIYSSLKPGGQIVLETLVIDDMQQNVLIPEGRYAKMRNVWFIPSVPMLELWLRRVGFRNICVRDVTLTTVQEQRRTSWMTFESLADFLDPMDSSRTIEGYPAPRRALLTATR